jgi:hypothetical protein
LRLLAVCRGVCLSCQSARKAVVAEARRRLRHRLGPVKDLVVPGSAAFKGARGRVDEGDGRQKQPFTCRSEVPAAQARHWAGASAMVTFAALLV